MAQQPRPDWLEPIVKLSDFNGDPNEYIEHLFSIFKRDFILNTPTFRNQKVLFDKKDDAGKPQAFVHITTEEEKATKQRKLCLRRCERIAWIKAIIEHCDDQSVLLWEAEHFGKRRTTKRIYLFLESENFLVILEEMKWGHYMITAIYVDIPNQKRKHLKSYQNFLKKSKSEHKN